MGAPRILFVGNSHTEYFVSIPQLFKELCEYNSIEFNQERLVEMAVSMDEIYQMDQAEADKLFSNTDKDGNYFDYIVLQEKTPVAAYELDKYKANVKMLTDKIRVNSPGSAVLVYQPISHEAYANNKTNFDEAHKVTRENALTVIANTPNSEMFRVGDSIKAAYEGDEGYQYQKNNVDMLRFGENTLHILNDGGFLASVLLFQIIFDKQPNIPEKMSLSLGTGDDDGQGLMPVGSTISNPETLAKIAWKHH